MQKKVPYVAQLGNMDCSIACMTMLFRYYGLDVDIVDVGQVVHIGRDGVNLTQLKQATQQFGFKCTAYRYNKQKNILDSNLPAVVYSGSHLAVIGSKTVLGQYILLDPIKGKSIVNFEQIHDTFSDILITIRPEKRIKRKKCKPKLKVAINYKLVAGIISLMLLIQALTLSIPLVEQALIDSITQSQSLLNSAYILQFVKEPHHQAAQQPSAASKIQKYFPKACKQRRFHAQFASFFRFMAANLSLTHCVTRVRPLMWV